MNMSSARIHVRHLTFIAWLGMTIVAGQFSLIAAEQIGVRVRFGVRDRQTAPWDGSVSVSDGRLLNVDGWRFQQSDGLTGPTAWKAQTRRSAVRRTNNPKRAQGKQNSAPVMDNGILLTIDDVQPNTRVAIKTMQGDFDFSVSELTLGAMVARLGGRVEIERTASTLPIASTSSDDDFPALATAPDGTTALAYVSFMPGLDRDERARTLTKSPDDFEYLKTPVGGDHVWLRYLRGNAW